MATATFRNRALLNAHLSSRPKLKEDSEQRCLHDLRRNCHLISIGDNLLRDLFIKELKIERSSFSEEEFKSELNAKLNIGHIKKIFSEHLLPKISDNSTDAERANYAKLLTCLVVVMNQNAFLNPAQLALANTATSELKVDGPPVNSKNRMGRMYSGFTSTGMTTRVNIFQRKDGQICMDEQTEVMHLTDTSAKSSAFIRQGNDYINEEVIERRFKNPDDSSMLTVKSRILLKPNINTGAMQYQNTDVTLEYHNDTLKVIHDSRGLLTWLKDKIKAVLGKNNITSDIPFSNFKEKFKKEVQEDKRGGSLDDESLSSDSSKDDLPKYLRP